MPIYEYVCSKCNTKFEKMRPISQASDGAPCPRCQAKAERILSSFCSFTKSEGGMTVPTGGSSCGGCSATSCSTCGH